MLLVHPETEIEIFYFFWMNYHALRGGGGLDSRPKLCSQYRSFCCNVNTFGRNIFNYSLQWYTNQHPKSFDPEQKQGNNEEFCNRQRELKYIQQLYSEI